MLGIRGAGSLRFHLVSTSGQCVPAVTVGAEPQQPKGFLEWCRDAAAPAEVRYTVTVLIAYLETDDCATAARSLATEDRLDLENYAVTREFGLDEYRPPPPTFAQMIAERPVRDLRPIPEGSVRATPNRMA